MTSPSEKNKMMGRMMNNTTLNDNCWCKPIDLPTNIKTLDGGSCQICKYEIDLTRVKNVMMCERHHIRLCVTRRNDDNVQLPHMCSDQRFTTCWEKFHGYYLHKQLFTSSPSAHSIFCNVRRGSYHWKHPERKQAIRNHKRKREDLDEENDN